MQSSGFCNTLITLSKIISNSLSLNKSLLSILKGGFLLFGEGGDREALLRTPLEKPQASADRNRGGCGDR
jgi:hypothetical protein